jgi:hypothetical protein
MNPFNNGSSLFPYRWFLVFATVLTVGMAAADYTGWRVLSFNSFGTGGPGGYGSHGYYGSTFYHK